MGVGVKIDNARYIRSAVVYEKNQTRRHSRDKTHPRVAAPHIPRGVVEWNISCCHKWMKLSLILFIYHVELSMASGISELYHDEKCVIKSRNTNFVLQNFMSMWDMMSRY